MVGAALRTFPYRLVLAQPLIAAALPVLADVLDDLPGVVGGVPEASDFADAWTAKTGAIARVDVGQGVYALDRVVPRDLRRALPARPESPIGSSCSTGYARFRSRRSARPLPTRNWSG